MRPESRDALLAAIAKARGWIDIRLGRIASFAEIAERQARDRRRGFGRAAAQRRHAKRLTRRNLWWPRFYSPLGFLVPQLFLIGLWTMGKIIVLTDYHSSGRHSAPVTESAWRFQKETEMTCRRPVRKNSSALEPHNDATLDEVRSSLASQFVMRTQPCEALLLILEG
jgi:hypothetical protein